MKKLLATLSISIFMLASCSPASDDTATTPPVLLTKTIDTYNSGAVVTTNYTYTGNKVLTVISDDPTDPQFCYVTYNGDLITQMQYRFPDGSIDENHTYEYDSANRLISRLSVQPSVNTGYKTWRTYNTDGTVTLTKYSGDATTQTTLNSTKILTFVNGEVTSIDQGNNYRHYTYDNNNNPLKNMACWEQLNVIEYPEGVSHNIISTTNGQNGSTIIYTTQRPMTYNAALYPITSIERYGNSNSYTREYFY
jgi:hypothetical protein